MIAAGTLIVGRYEIVRELGAGGMGAVYKARHLSMDRMVALKLIHPHIASRAEVAARFHREMKAMSKIEHPNTIQVFDYGATEDGQLFLAMELVDGRSLARVIETDGPLPTQRILHIARQVVRALGAAHQEGIAHRDLKPDNVMLVDRYGEHDIVKVLDFGIARFIDPSEADQIDASRTAEGALLGTPAYMSPEQALGRPIDQRTDFYSLGVMLYQLGVGRLPFEAPTLGAFLIAHATERPTPPSELVPGRMPARLEACILNLLAKTPEERPANAAELLSTLDACAQATEPTPVLNDKTFPDRPEMTDKVGPTRVKAAPRRRWPIVLTIAALVGGVGTLRHFRTLSSLRLRLDALAVAHRDPPAPESCRVTTASLMEKMVRAGEALRGSELGQPRPQDREALMMLAPDSASPSGAAEYWAMAARALLVVDPDPKVALAAADRAAACADYAYAHELVGAAQQRAHGYVAARAAHERALQLSPTYLVPRFNLGLLDLAEGKYAAAVSRIDEVLIRDPKYPHARLPRAQAELLIGRGEAALADLETAVELEPRNPEAWLLLGNARALAKKPEANAAYCRAAELGSIAARSHCATE